MRHDELKLLLYLETRAVDHGGRVDTRRMNEAEMDIANRWNAEGFLEFGRIVYADCTPHGSHWVRLSDDAWQKVHAERKARARRVWAKRTFQTTAEKARRGNRKE